MRLKSILIVLFFGGSIALTTASGAKINHIAFGSQDAPLRVTQFTSYGCPDCIDFRREEFGQILKFIANEQVHYTIRAFPRNKFEVPLSMLGICLFSDLGVGTYLSVEKEFYENKKSWFTSDAAEARSALVSIAEAHDYSESQVDACLGNSEIRNLLAETMKIARENNVTRFPSFLISRQGDAKIENIEVIEAEVRDLLQISDGEDLGAKPASDQEPPNPVSRQPEISKPEMLMKCRSQDWQMCYDYAGSTQGGWTLIHSLCDDEANAGACEFVATIYRVGSVGVEKDGEKSSLYYSKACEFGHKASCSR